MPSNMPRTVSPKPQMGHGVRLPNAHYTLGVHKVRCPYASSFVPNGETGCLCRMYHHIEVDGKNSGVLFVLNVLEFP